MLIGSRRGLPPINLRQLVLILSGVSVVLTLASVMWASYRVQKELLIDSTLEANRVYALKLADTTDYYLDGAKRMVRTHAQSLAEHWGSVAELSRDIQRILAEYQGFNSVLVVDAEGRVVTTAPQVLAPGTRLNSLGARLALQHREVQVSPPYVGASGRLVVVVSSPIFAQDGRYLGYVAGSIYLHEDNALHRLLGEHYYKDGSYLYVVDGDRRVIYHRDTERIGERIDDNAVVDRVLAGKAGSMQAPNSRRVQMLAGFSPLRSVHWGVVAQRPLDTTLARLDALSRRLVLYTLPLLLVTLGLIWWLSRLIALPLWKLARRAQIMEEAGAEQSIQGVRAWYYEVAQLKRAILAGLSAMSSTIRRLNTESLTDPLTGLLNRRGLQEFLEQWREAGRGFSVIVLDIDHFKAINDTWGHDSGDRVLSALGGVIGKALRPGDVSCRSGGEEFTILLPDTPLELGTQTAERLRQLVEETLLGMDVAITISLGVAHFPDTADEVAAVLKQADRALYQAKEQGRNRTVQAG
ncbi:MULTISPECIES: GGDEF domain-containing protein [Gammaproteobacteria]|uniref:diguanylate cyclase n=1 Tax=Xanthomonas boreopolis TaxID=86183 RepID=A0A919F594_9XANT|nr:sensor domain-containing diguanylate cyclase [Pseudomonas sp. Hp2]GHH48357.1 cell signaling regulator [[Pseudomonas] boreopolis]